MTKNLSEYTDKEILDAYDNARGSMSYYNAAEGSSWGKEKDGRRKATRWLSEVRQELNQRGLEGRPGNYLC